jgi:hypothetical protein
MHDFAIIKLLVRKFKLRLLSRGAIKVDIVDEIAP